MSPPIAQSTLGSGGTPVSPTPPSPGPGGVAVTGRPSLMLRRRIAAAPARVFAAWTGPEQLARWWGPAGTILKRADLDVRPGGRFSIRFATPDGEEHGVGGGYLEVVPTERLVFDWAWQSTPERVSLVTLRLSPDGDGTLLTLAHEQFFDEAARDGHARGWTVCLDRLVALYA
jgi:uncharacterized protein YndB with AHSA1/START domain